MRQNAADGPPSTAWLAAQQAFSEPRPASAEQPQVLVRKGRAPVVHAFAAAPAVAPAAATPMAVSHNKPARVFRVVSAPAVPPLAAAAEQAAASEPGIAQVQADVPRRRRTAAYKRPGPVLHIVHELPAPVPSPAAQAQQLPQHQLRTLVEMLARVDAVLGDIRRARSFQFDDALRS